MVGRFSAVDILRFFLHGTFALYPIAFFPEIIDAIGPARVVIFGIVAGMFLYAVPIDLLVPSYRRYYDRELNEHVESIVGRKLDNVRSLYDVFFYEKLTPDVRYRVHFQVSLYYFYSRTCFVSLLHAIIFALASLYLVIPRPPSSVLNTFPNEGWMVLLDKSIVLVVLSCVIAIVAFLQSSNVIKRVSFFEKALVDYHSKEIREIALTSGKVVSSSSSS